MENIVLITGCSRGIGYECAKILVFNNFKVYACVRAIEENSDILQLLQKHKNLVVEELDVTNHGQVDALVEKIIRIEGKIDILINNAAQILFGLIESVSMQQAREIFEVNFFAPLKLIQAVLPYMRKNNSGHIICMGSTSGVVSYPMYGLYSSTKFAMEALVFALVGNLLPWNIKVSIFELSATSTQICEKSLKLGENKLKEPSYDLYTQNSLSFLKEIISLGESPQKIAKEILKLIKEKNPPLRYFGTEKSEKVFIQKLKDPYGARWMKEINLELEWFEKDIKK